MTGKRYTLRQAAELLEIPYSERVYNVKEAAKILKISDSHCRRLLENKIIKGKQHGRIWLITDYNLKYKRLRKQREKGG